MLIFLETIRIDGTHVLAVKDNYKEFKQLALNLAKVCAIQMVNNES
jgi:hypothetical protein